MTEVEQCHSHDSYVSDGGSPTPQLHFPTHGPGTWEAIKQKKS